MKITAIPIQQTFNLESDEDGIASVTIRQAREGEQVERQDFFSRVSRVYEDPLLGNIGLSGRIRLETEQNRLRLLRKEAYLTLARVSNITLSDGNELFRTETTVDGPSVRAAMTEDEFNRAWGLLPSEVAAEISQYVHDVNVQWSDDPNGSRSTSDESEETPSDS